MLEIKSIKHVYGPDSQLTYPDWQVDNGVHSIIIGNSGSGKTTLLHLIGGLMTAEEGEVWIDQVSINSLSQTELDRFRGAHIGIVFQRPHLVSSLSVLENLNLAQYLGKKKINRGEVRKMMEQLDILHLSSRKVHQISQGQAQRVSIARALLNKPKLLLADEPTASLDDTNCQKVVQLLKQQAESCGSTLIIATHDHRVKSEFENQLVL